jgi:uncharacterized membrane protein YbhN (UPF0104 family)
VDGPFAGPPAYPDHPRDVARPTVLSTNTPTPEQPLAVAPSASEPPSPVRAAPRRGPSRLTLLGIAVSVVALGFIVWWATKQKAPRLPHTTGEFAALIGAVALYGLATVVRAERWQRLLVDEGARPPRPDTYALTCIGYMGNNVLPARAGDAIRVVLMAPPAQTSKLTVVGTLVAERLLDIAVLLVLFVVVGYGLLGDVNGDKVGIIVAVLAVAAIIAAISWRFVRRNERLHAMITPLASATLGLRRANHGLMLLGLTLVIWAIEGGVWMSVGAAGGFDMTPIEALYLVALASIFSMIPSGPGYAGTQDAAVVIGIKAIGGTGATALTYLLTLRFVIVVPITLVGFVLLVIRYGGLARLRLARAEARS